MAAAVSSVWAKPGAWALEAEEHEAELKQQAPPTSNQKSSTTGDSSDFPSLAAAATTKSKKKKGQTISLAEFATYGVPKAAPVTERLTQAELVSLPTGPRERSAEELDRSKLGGGFRSNGSDSRWGPSRVSEDGDRRSRDRESNRDLGPSRADENDDWAATKKPIVSGNGYERRERSGGFFESQSQSSKADEVDSWVSSKPKFVSSGNGGDRFEKRGSFESLSRNRDSDSDSWARRREESVGEGGAAPPSGGSRPRLVLQPRTLPVPVVEVRPESPVNVRPESPVVVPVERPKGVNPFGNARPREEVLAEKGQDYKEIEEKLEADKLKDIAAAIEKSPGKIGFGLGNGRKDEHTERSWRKSPEQSEDGAKDEEPKEEEPTVEEEASKEEVSKEEATKEEEAENKN